VEVKKTINYNFYHWGPFLYATNLPSEELEKIKNLCNKKLPDYRSNLAGLLRHEHKLDVKKLFSIILPYLNSYAEAYADYSPTPLNGEIELMSAWVNYMTKCESNPLHTHDDDLSFVIYTQVPEELKKECNESVGNSKPGAIQFVHTLGTEKYYVNKQYFVPEEGNFFIFPASLHHTVNSFKSNGERISVSGNIKITNG
tara:strand:+ start:33 stop:629 length:597 start_codon:yes stop_codon:yes gene_type:complete